MNRPSLLAPPDAPVSSAEADALARALVRRTEALLKAHIPLSLLLDLAEPTGPRSAAVYAAEPGDAGWLQRP